MRNKLSGAKAHKEGHPEINILPLMNIVMLLIPFLLLSTQFIKIGVVEVSSPSCCAIRHDGPEQRPPKPPLNLSMSITRKGVSLLTRGAALGPGCKPRETKAALPTFQKVSTGHDWRSVRKCLKKLKADFPHEDQVIVMAEPEIKYKVIIKAMDMSRKDGKKKLFPRVLLSAGVM